jgi:uncharacterized protein YndB with AHSA1/START domain
MSNLQANLSTTPARIAILPNPLPTPLPNQKESDILLSLRIQTDRARVFYALSIPEYIEAWLCCPPKDKLRSVFHSVDEDAFRIDLYRAQTLQGSIHGNCSVPEENRIRYAWNTKSVLGVTETAVDIELLSALGGCTIRLSHSGFQDKSESAWHRELWQHSLATLSRLMEK